jgi:hypothetical protein
MSTVTFLSLPPELHLCIFQLLTSKAICDLRETCKFLCDFIDSNRELVWRNFAIQNSESYLDEKTAPCTGCRVSEWHGVPGAPQGSALAEELAAAIDAQKSALGSFDDITTWTDFGASCLYSFDLAIHAEVILAQSDVG